MTSKLSSYESLASNVILCIKSIIKKVLLHHTHVKCWVFVYSNMPYQQSIMILYILRGHPGGGARRTPELMVLRTCHVRVKVMSVEVLVPVKVPCYCSWSQRVCVPHSISHTGPLQNSTHHWHWNKSCNKVPTKNTNSTYQLAILQNCLQLYLRSCPFDRDESSMRCVETLIHQVPGHTKICYLNKNSYYLNKHNSMHVNMV